MFNIVDIKTTIVTEEEMINELEAFKEEHKEAFDNKNSNIVNKVKKLLNK